MTTWNQIVLSFGYVFLFAIAVSTIVMGCCLHNERRRTRRIDARLQNKAAEITELEHLLTL